jgi:tetratricopeptide (TPR) repeat protein
MINRLAQLESLLAEDPNDVFVVYAIALEHYKLGSAQKSIALLKDLIAQHESYVPAYFKLGQWLSEMDSMDDARNYLEVGITQAKTQNDTKAIQEMRELILFIEDYED